MNKRAQICMVIFGFLMCLLLSSCSPSTSIAPFGAMDTSGSDITEEQRLAIDEILEALPDEVPEKWENPKIEVREDEADLYHAMHAGNKEEALGYLLTMLDHAPSPYEYILRDSVTIHGKTEPCIWLFSKNGFGETLDILLYDKGQFTGSEIRDDDAFIGSRKNEGASFAHSWHYPEYMSGIGDMVELTSKNDKFCIVLCGQAFSLMDLLQYNDSVVAEDREWDWSIQYWDGDSWEWPDDKQDRKSPFQADQKRFPTHTPEINMKHELTVMLESLYASGENYTVEMQNREITIEGKSYPVVWVFAWNQKGEWLDILFSEDPDFCYLMERNKEEIATQRKTQLDELDRKDEDWLMQDVFYNGYSYFMDGDAHSIRDAGMAWGMK